jgi:hypothetical protein
MNKNCLSAKNGRLSERDRHSSFRDIFDLKMSKKQGGVGESIAYEYSIINKYILSSYYIMIYRRLVIGKRSRQCCIAIGRAWTIA